MENRSVLKRFLSIVFVLGLLALPGMGLSYNDALDKYAETSTHQAINRYAVELFEQHFLNSAGTDRYLKYAAFNENLCYGIDWHPATDGPRDKPPRIEQKRQKPLRDWIIHGGFSADQPEWPMALLHFYDPINTAKPWLTDQQYMVNFLRRFGGSTIANPERDAVTWTFSTKPGDLSEHVDWFIQEYGWIQAKEYLQRALQSRESMNEDYGRAWRAIGEVMHMVADMTVPAHVRNDGHAAERPISNADPYEYNTYGRDVVTHKDSSHYANLNYFRFDAENIMRSVAQYTNKNFFSKDTIPGNDNPSGTYAHPDIAAMTIDVSGNYLHTTTDGKYYVAARPSTLGGRWRRNEGYPLTPDVREQQSILIPTAIRAGAGIIYAFLPRFEVKAEVTRKQDRPGWYQVYGKLTHHPNFNWPTRVEVQNGAVIIVKSGQQETRIPVERADGQPLNTFVEEVEAGENDTIWVEYDFGGYAISSAGLGIDSLTPKKGIVGSDVVIKGRGFGLQQGQSKVYFSDVPATHIVSWSDTEIKVKVPNEAPGISKVKVKVEDTNSTNEVDFEVTLSVDGTISVNTDDMCADPRPTQISTFRVQVTSPFKPPLEYEWKAGYQEKQAGNETFTLDTTRCPTRSNCPISACSLDGWSVTGYVRDALGRQGSRPWNWGGSY